MKISMANNPIEPFLASRWFALAGDLAGDLHGDLLLETVGRLFNPAVATQKNR